MDSTSPKLFNSSKISVHMHSNNLSMSLFSNTITSLRKVSRRKGSKLAAMYNSINNSSSSSITSIWWSTIMVASRTRLLASVAVGQNHRATDHLTRIRRPRNLNTSLLVHQLRTVIFTMACSYIVARLPQLWTAHLLTQRLASNKWLALALGVYNS